MMPKKIMFDDGEHCHWTYQKLDSSYVSMFTYATREDAVEAAEWQAIKLAPIPPYEVYQVHGSKCRCKQ